jgi:hypothetical protein
MRIDFSRLFLPLWLSPAGVLQPFFSKAGD